jgi:PTH1 family peptidyl-tRNA hydrolase
MKPKGSAGGHNGLTHINNILGTDEYPRIRVGIGNSFTKGNQVDYVLGVWSQEEKKFLEDRITIVVEMIRSFAFAGLELTMTSFNKAGKVSARDNETGKECP